MLESEELDDPQVNRRVKTQPAFVWADRIIELHPVSTVYLDFALVVQPGHPEHDHTVRDHNALKDFGFHKFRMLLNRGLKGCEHLLDSLMEFGLALVFFLHASDDILND